jgi:hypothetical protein
MEDGEELDHTEDVPKPVVEDDKIKVNVIQPFRPSVRISRVVRQGKCYYHPAKPASYICASCGKSVCTVCGRDVGGVYFCPQCAPPEVPIAQPVTPKVEEPNINAYRALFSIGIILIIIGAILLAAYWPLSSMSAADFENLRKEYRDDGSHNFKEFRPGDIIVIKDKIIRVDVQHDPAWGVVTTFWFDTTGPDDLDFSLMFDGDLERDYREGDVVSITLHVEEDSRTQNEIIREDHNNIPDISNIDHTLSVDLVFISFIVLGGAFVVIYFMFYRKFKAIEGKEPKKEEKVKDKPKKVFTSKIHEGEGN